VRGTRYLPWRARIRDLTTCLTNGESDAARQGQYLAFIYAYARVLERPPAEADIQRHLKVTPPTVHQMLITLERTGLIRRKPGVARSIELRIEPESLPVRRRAPARIGRDVN
jgi:DNA-binding MarR family transcriptional regulator